MFGSRITFSCKIVWQLPPRWMCFHFGHTQTFPTEHYLLQFEHSAARDNVSILYFVKHQKSFSLFENFWLVLYGVGMLLRHRTVQRALEYVWYRFRKSIYKILEHFKGNNAQLVWLQDRIKCLRNAIHRANFESYYNFK